MRKPLFAALVLLTTVSACGYVRESRINPFNWFGDAEPAPAPQVADLPAPVDHRLLAHEITAMKVEPMPGGAILRATALMPAQGYWNAELVALDAQPLDGRLVYEFRVLPPLSATAQSTPRSRQITAAVHLSDIRLDQITSVSVVGETNGLTSRR